MKKSKQRYGYHLARIKKGVLGDLSKIQEEVDELKDAEKQKVKILVACELADLYGAIKEYARLNCDLTMEDLRDMSELTSLAFKQGYR